jgi:hypothetical protein
MELTGPACTEAMSGAEEDERRERAEDNAGGVRVELRVRAQRETTNVYNSRVEKSIGILVAHRIVTQPDYPFEGLRG